MVISRPERIYQAYLRMAREARYWPAAPGDGLGSAHLFREDLKDLHILEAEAREYAERFIREEDSLQFHIGCSNWSTNRALVFVIEAARLLCGGADEIAFRSCQWLSTKLHHQQGELKHDDDQHY